MNDEVVKEGMGFNETVRKLGEDLYASNTDRDCKYLGLEWMINRFVEQDLDANIETMFKCHAELKERCTTAENQFEYNDLDCHAYVVPWADDEYKREYCAFVHEDQNRNVLYVLRKEPEETKQLYKEHDLGDCPKDAVSMYQFKSYEYPDLPELETLLENRGSRYNDGRDKEFLTSNADGVNRVEDALHRISGIRWAIFDIETLWCALNEE